jgi:hypothetical protein
MAVTMVLIACFMDGVDGSAARLLKSSSDIDFFYCNYFSRYITSINFKYIY